MKFKCYIYLLTKRGVVQGERRIEEFHRKMIHRFVFLRETLEIRIFAF